MISLGGQAPHVRHMECTCRRGSQTESNWPPFGVKLNGSGRVLGVRGARGHVVADDVVHLVTVLDVDAHLSTIAANRFADKMIFTPSVVEYPFFTWRIRVVKKNGLTANRFAAKWLTCRALKMTLLSTSDSWMLCTVIALLYVSWMALLTNSQSGHRP